MDFTRPPMLTDTSQVVDLGFIYIAPRVRARVLHTLCAGISLERLVGSQLREKSARQTIGAHTPLSEQPRE